MNSKTILKFDIEELESDAASLKWSALTNAARMSCYKSEYCLGPRREKRNKSLPEKFILSNSASEVKPEKLEMETDKVESFALKSQTLDYDIFDKFALLKLAEKQRKDNVRKELERKQKEFNRHSELQNRLSIESRQQVKSANDKKYRAEQEIIKEAETIAADLTEENRKRIQFQYDEHRKRLEHLKGEQMLRQKRILCENVFKYQLKFGETYQQIANRFKQIDRNTYTNGEALNNSLRLLIAKFDGLVQKIKSSDIGEGDLQIAETLYFDIEKLRKQLDAEIMDLSRQSLKVAADAVDLIVAESPHVMAESPQVMGESPQVVTKSPQVIAETPQLQQRQQHQQVFITPDSIQIAQDLSSYVSPENFAFYNGIMAFYTSKVESVKPLQADDNMKKYRSNCQKAINFPVNAISAVSAQHLQDKYDKLYGLLSGTQINTPDGLLSVMDHPLGRDFCLLLLAKKFVSQGDSTISSNPIAAFPIAAVIVAIWQKIPDFGKLFLAYAFKDCPYLVPYFVPQFKGQSIEDYSKVLGYQLGEKQDMYLKRQTGLIKLYAAVMVTRTRSKDGPIHPYGIENGWRWLNNLLNLEPLPEICATLILGFLQIAGFEIWRIYRNQFTKILRILQIEYLPRLSQFDEGGPKARLEVFLMKVMKDNMIETPAGLLAPNFW